MTTTTTLHREGDVIVREPTLPSPATARWIAWSGFVYVGAWLLGLAIGFATNAPGPEDSPQMIGAYFSQHRQPAMLQAYLLDGVAGVALVAFGAGLRSWFSARQQERNPLAGVVLGTAVAAGTLSLVQGLFTQVLADHVAAIGDASTIRALYDLNTEGDSYKLLALGLFLAASAWLIFRTRALPAWLGWAAVVLGPLLTIAGWNFLIPPGLQYTAYAVLLVGLLVWVAAVAVASLRSGPDQLH